MTRGRMSRLLERTTALVSAMLVAAPLLPVIEARTIVAAPVDPLGCADRVYDPTGAGSTSLDTVAEQMAVRLMADLHIRIERSLDGDIDARQRLLEQQCAGWLAADGLRASNLLVVMVSPVERQTSIYFGEDFEDTLSAAGPQIQEFVMNPRFQDGDYAGGLVDGLVSIQIAVGGGGVPQAATSATRPASSSTGTDGGTDDGPPLGLIIGLIAVLSLIGIASSFSQRSGSESGAGRGSRTRRSYSSSSARRSSSRSSGRSRSSSRSRRSGGGGSSSSW